MEELHYDEDEYVERGNCRTISINWKLILAYFISLLGLAYFVMRIIIATNVYNELDKIEKSLGSVSLAYAIFWAIAVLFLSFFISMIIVHIDRKEKQKKLELFYRKKQCEELERINN